MTDDQDLIALYRAGATEEPDPALDAAILRAVQRRRMAPIAGLFFATAACLALITFTMSHAPIEQASAVAQPPGLNEGRARFIARDLSPATDSPGLTIRPVANNGAMQ